MLECGKKLEHVRTNKINYFDLVGSRTNREIIVILQLWVKVLLTFVEFTNVKLNKIIVLS